MNVHTIPKISSPADRPALQAQAWRISYLAAAPGEQVPLAVINEPSNVVAVAAPVNLADVLADVPAHIPTMSAGRQDDSLLVVWVPAAAGQTSDLDSRLNAWLRGDLAPSRAPVQASIKTIRIVCTDTRAVVYAAPEQLSEAMDALARFTLAARQTSALEVRMAATWPQIRAHTPLTHAVTRKQQRMQPQIDAQTERVTEMKSMLLRLQTALEQLDPTLSGTSKRMYADLAAAAALNDRLEMLGDPIQFALDLYELANSRLTEIGAAQKGHFLEVLIVIILLADFGLRAFDVVLPRISLMFSTVIP
jgi:acyl carrier protein phosphodiesterase